MLGFAFSPEPVRNFADAQALDHALYASFFQAMLDRGVWLPPSGYEAMFLSAAHQDIDIDGIIQAAGDALQEVAS